MAPSGSEGEDCDLRALVRVGVRQCQLQGTLTDLINDCLAGRPIGEAGFKVQFSVPVRVGDLLY